MADGDKVFVESHQLVVDPRTADVVSSLPRHQVVSHDGKAVAVAFIPQHLRPDLTVHLDAVGGGGTSASPYMKWPPPSRENPREPSPLPTPSPSPAPGGKDPPMWQEQAVKDWLYGDETPFGLDLFKPGASPSPSPSPSPGPGTSGGGGGGGDKGDPHDPTQRGRLPIEETFVVKNPPRPTGLLDDLLAQTLALHVLRTRR